MNHTPLVRAAILCAAAFPIPLLVPALAAGQEDLQKASIAISLTATRRDGSSVTTVTGSSALKVGETNTQYIYTTTNGDGRGVSAGSPPEGDSGVAGGTVRPTVVGGVVEGKPMTRPAARYNHLWQVEVKTLAVGVDVVTFELDWKRTDVKDEARQVVPGDRRTITLRQGEKHVLDFIGCPPDARNANVFISVEAAPVEDASLANLKFTYDLWLVHRTAEGAKVTRHAVLTGRQGEKLKFGFDPVPLPLEVSAAPESDSPFKLYVTGTIAGRQKSDGTLEIALHPSRSHRSRTGSVGSGGGVKTFASRIDETTSVSLPAGSGFSSWGAGDAVTLSNPRRGVSVTGGTVRVDARAFFEGTETSILLTVHRER